jgi:hypothetical protein
MEPATLSSLEEQLRALPPNKLALVARFVASLAGLPDDEGLLLLIAAESSLRKDWDRPEEDEAWDHL